MSDWSGESLSDNFIQSIDNSKLSDLPQLNDVDYAPCVGDIGKFMCIGLNYSDHAKEVGMDPPAEPILFMKATSAVIGPNDNVEIPKNLNKKQINLLKEFEKETSKSNSPEANDYISKLKKFLKN